MNENTDLLPDLLHEEFEVQMRGYSRRQVDDFVARRNSEIRDLEQRLSRALDETEHLRREVSVMRQHALSGKPAHEEISERMAQILKLADDEAQAQKDKAGDEINKLRADAQAESDRVRGDAREQTERMLTAAQEQAERTIAAARSEADKTRTSARAESDRLTNDARGKSDAALANAKAQAKKVLDEATARATAIHDGADRRLNLLSNRHTDTIRRLTDILEGVSGLVEAENARPSLDEEVEQAVVKSLGTQPDSQPTRASAPADAPTSTSTTPQARTQVQARTPAQASSPDMAGSPGKAEASAAKRETAPPAPPNPATRVSTAAAPAVSPAAPFGGSPASPKPTNDNGATDPDNSAPDRPVRHEPGRADVIDPDEATEGIRLMPS
jgi:cell division septum initiation protein DivIVA